MFTEQYLEKDPLIAKATEKKNRYRVKRTEKGGQA